MCKTRSNAPDCIQIGAQCRLPSSLSDAAWAARCADLRGFACSGPAARTFPASMRQRRRTSASAAHGAHRPRHGAMLSCCWMPAAAAIVGCCLATKLVSMDAGAPALRSWRFRLQMPFAEAVRPQDCNAAFVLIGLRAAAEAAARCRQRERAWRKGSPSRAKRLQQAAAAASNARWRAAMRHSTAHGCREPVHACMRACNI